MSEAGDFFVHKPLALRMLRVYIVRAMATRIPTAADIKDLRSILGQTAKALGHARPSVRKGRNTMRGVVVQAKATGNACAAMMDAMAAAGFIPADGHGTTEGEKRIPLMAGENFGMYLNGLYVREVAA